MFCRLSILFSKLFKQFGDNYFDFDGIAVRLNDPSIRRIGFAVVMEKFSLLNLLYVSA